uniref:Equilibrative nucleoside transporter 1 n=1 Tax=Arcella intermedia TaxID=1963864 RepID=A0A6B2L5H2_9EUKA|eukprot:TRINITY_DN5874_c0_g1_i1.p1 TRINITY_DN5874_c0_g1~~TRINITY_DN5874_c0_g1_i1.p1  ORF type:complete len:431 (+),score=53.13 TRINITY_DN5874_c0_g1_i1:71-1294(+)
MDDDMPKDKYNFVWFLCAVLGIGQLFPWNAFISGFDYFIYLFDPFPIVFALPIANNWGSMAAFLVLTKYGSLVSPTKRLYVAYFVTFAMLFLVPVINIVNWNRMARVWLTLIATFLTGAATAVMTGTTFGIVAVLPNKYVGAVMSGQGIAGILAGGIKLCVNFWWFTETETNKGQLTTSGVLYFGIASILIMMVFYATLALVNTDFYLYYSQRSTEIGTAVQDNDISVSEPFSGTTLVPTTLDVFKKIWVKAIHVFLVFFVTLTLFPGFTTKMRNYDRAHLTDGNFGVILISLFQLFDTVGRTLPTWFVFPKAKYLPIPVWLRILLFTPLIMLSVYTDALPSNWIPYITMALFATSNGYFSTVGMMYGSSSVTISESSTAGLLMSLFLQLGVFAGVHFAMILSFIIK